MISEGRLPDFIRIKRELAEPVRGVSAEHGLQPAALGVKRAVQVVARVMAAGVGAGIIGVKQVGSPAQLRAVLFKILQKPLEVAHPRGAHPVAQVELPHDLPHPIYYRNTQRS